MAKTETKTKIQTRGHCQVCGRVQAVKGTMSKHGYTVKHGWFNGVCSGEHHQPMELDRKVVDETVSQIFEDVKELKKIVEDLKSGKTHPMTVKLGYGKNEKTIPFVEATKYDQQNAIRMAIYSTENRIRSGLDHASMLKDLADKFHGKLLIEVNKEENLPEKINIGEVRIVSERVGEAEAVRIEGARVYWKAVNSERKGAFWMGTSAWRRLEKVRG